MNSENTMHPKIIQQLIDMDIEVTVTKSGYCVTQGFERIGGALLALDAESGEVTATINDVKYDNLSFDDLVRESFFCWSDHQRYGGDRAPDSKWLPEYQRLGLIEVTQKTVYRPKRTY
jgi:hypothetical protein